MAIDVAYNDDLLITIVNDCASISIYDLAGNSEKPVRTFSIGSNVVIDQVVYCSKGDYLACVGHNNGLLSIYTIFDWRVDDPPAQSEATAANDYESDILASSNNITKPTVLELSVNVDSTDGDRRDKLNNIDCCQRTGNLAASCGDTILIYKFLDGSTGRPNSVSEQNIDGQDEIIDETEQERVGVNATSHDANKQEHGGLDQKEYFKHIISIKLSMWALKIDLAENYLSIMAMEHVQVLKLELLTLQIQSEGLGGSDLLTEQNMDLNTDITSETNTSNNTSHNSTQSSDANSTATNFSSFTRTDSKMSIITMDQQNKVAHDDCTTWNLNTKKLVKLPTLMHNTSTNLSDYHICHPLELLGPASESIACRVSASIYSEDYSQNQLEAVVMLCKQFDFDRDPVKSTHLQAVYLSSYEHQRRLSRASGGANHHANTLYNDLGHCNRCAGNDIDDQDDQGSCCCSGKEVGFLKSDDYELLAAVTCFVSTLTNCFIYALHGKKVTRTQVITNPDLCLDLRPDLLNVYLLTPLGLLINSSGVCDSTFRYEWSSSADLNLSFTAIDCKRILTSSNYIILIGCVGEENDYMVKIMEKPDLLALYGRIVHTVSRCDSVSIKSNLLTYLHATSQLTLQNHRRKSLNQHGVSDVSAKSFNANRPRDQLVLLKQVTVMLCKQLLQKKHTNMMTNERIDKTVRHLLDISMCDIKEPMIEHLESLKFCEDRHSSDESEQGDEQEDVKRAELSKVTTEGEASENDILEKVDENSESELAARQNSDLQSDQVSLAKKGSPKATASNSSRGSNSCLTGNDPLGVPVARSGLGTRSLSELSGYCGSGRAGGKLTPAIDKWLQMATSPFVSWQSNQPENSSFLESELNIDALDSDARDGIEQDNHLMQSLDGHNKSDFNLQRNFSALHLNGYTHRRVEIDKQSEPGDQQTNNNKFNLQQRSTSPPVVHRGQAMINLNAERDEEDEDEIYERKLQLIAELPLEDLIDLLAVKIDPKDGDTSDKARESEEDQKAARACIEASINLLESQFILNGLRERFAANTMI